MASAANTPTAQIIERICRRYPSWQLRSPNRPLAVGEILVIDTVDPRSVEVLTIDAACEIVRARFRASGARKETIDELRRLELAQRARPNAFAVLALFPGHAGVTGGDFTPIAGATSAIRSRGGSA